MADRITSKRLVLRLLTEHDFEPVVAMLSEPGVTPWWPRFDAPRIRTELFTPQKDVLVWGIETAGELIGAVTAHEENDPDYPSAGIEIFIGEAWWGRGFGTETVGTDAGQGAHYTPPFPAHFTLHGAGKYGLQCLANLDRLPSTGAMLIAAPLKIKNGTGSPLRVLAMVERDACNTRQS